MINTEMRSYDYYTYSGADAYGQPQLSTEVKGSVKMAIYITSQSVQDNINYKNANYIGLTSALLEDNAVIQYGDKKLKVLYVNPVGRYKQVFMCNI
jgi:hypothetical protein